ncbi:MAG: DUF4230 domain-containing protein [Lachnospiraceae bacterium]|jgi:hypothetical protein|nr:DUF4230 domain-containing protein [Lachnospiraceae bacterium]
MGTGSKLDAHPEERPDVHTDAHPGEKLNVNPGIISEGQEKQEESKKQAKQAKQEESENPKKPEKPEGAQTPETPGLLKSVLAPVFFGFAVVIAIFAFVVAGVLLTRTGTKRTVGGGMTFQTIREVSQLATLEYRYRDVIIIAEEEEYKLFGIWDIDPGEHLLIVAYDGIIKLGVDCGQILFNEYAPDGNGKRKLEILLPPTIILSSETPMDSFVVMENRGVYTRATVDYRVFFEEAAKRQKGYGEDVLSGEPGQTARENAKLQLKAMLESLDAVRENYEIVFAD